MTDGRDRTAVPESANGTVDGELLQTIEAVEEGDFLVLNSDFRIWEVTDVVDRPIEDPADDRQSKHVLRLAN
ncbi:hypothetical protein NDI56_20790 [Haloarcula sp. S1CR25-12]|uniref:Uncharacterized protein n=1 Tax=Haloarcula saliterrae TaxID=2950534 RepID=A0ABU2FJG2_9EURY|nr:hypothetical protein [Haloarcula sp. S1CR25-12]MDS0261845.1 hypothetical protein [Haloarcula sp. S1CR25-12]